MQKKLFKYCCLLILLAMFVPEAVAKKQEESLKYFVCKKCMILTCKAVVPDVKNCRAKGNHQWFEIAVTGENLYECIKCRATIAVKRKPKVALCPQKGEHSWSPLGKIGVNMYQCKKCELSVSTASTPKPSQCVRGGVHSWGKK